MGKEMLEPRNGPAVPLAPGLAFFAPSTDSMNAISQRRLWALCLGVLLMPVGTALASQPAARLVFDTTPAARFEFQGPVGERVKANVDNWLLRAPEANPGMLEMFRVRDRQPTPQLVPWAGEFVGKYLISAVQALRMSDDPRLRRQVAERGHGVHRHPGRGWLSRAVSRGRSGC